MLLKDELLRRNAELAAEACAIDKEEAGGEEQVEVEEEQVEVEVGSQVAAGKCGADKVKGDDEGEDKVDAKRSKGVANGLLKFVGSVSDLYRVCWAWLFAKRPRCSAIAVLGTSLSRPAL
jgi:hypothetical protein